MKPLIKHYSYYNMQPLMKPLTKQYNYYNIQPRMKPLIKHYSYYDIQPCMKPSANLSRFLWPLWLTWQAVILLLPETLPPLLPLQFDFFCPLLLLPADALSLKYHDASTLSQVSQGGLWIWPCQTRGLIRVLWQVIQQWPRAIWALPELKH